MNDARDFIEVTPDALDRASCAAIVARLRDSSALQPGRIGSGVFPDLKDSRDLGISGKPEWAQAEQAINQAVFAGLLAYLRRYPQALIAPLMLQQPGDDGAPRRLTAEDIGAMDDAALSPLASTCLRPGAINLQWYAAGRGGYPYWHCELYPRDPGCETLHRHLLWTLYLNDDFDAGETEFLFQQRKVVPQAGRLLLAPAQQAHAYQAAAGRRRTRHHRRAQLRRRLFRLGCGVQLP